jgi:hypothetical protein
LLADLSWKKTFFVINAMRILHLEVGSDEKISEKSEVWIPCGQQKCRIFRLTKDGVFIIDDWV